MIETMEEIDTFFCLFCADGKEFNLNESFLNMKVLSGSIIKLLGKSLFRSFLNCILTINKVFRNLHSEVLKVSKGEIFIDVAELLVEFN